MRIDGQNNKKKNSNAYLCEKRKSTCVSILLIFVIKIWITLGVINSTEEKYKAYRIFRNQERLQYMYTSRCLINTSVKQKVETLKENNNSKKHFSELKCFYRKIKTQPCLSLENEADRNFRSYPEVHITRIVHG